MGQFCVLYEAWCSTTAEGLLQLSLFIPQFDFCIAGSLGPLGLLAVLPPILNSLSAALLAFLVFKLKGAG